jgi:hypothetical protein
LLGKASKDTKNKSKLTTFAGGTQCKRHGCETQTENQSKRTASCFLQNENETGKKNKDLFPFNVVAIVTRTAFI